MKSEGKLLSKNPPVLFSRNASGMSAQRNRLEEELIRLPRRSPLYRPADIFVSAVDGGGATRKSCRKPEHQLDSICQVYVSVSIRITKKTGLQSTEYRITVKPGRKVVMTAEG